LPTQLPHLKGADVMTSILDAILFFGIKVPVFAWFLVSPPVYIWWFFNTDMRDRFTDRHEKIAAGVGIGSFLCLIFVLMHGIEDLLWFIPAEWGIYDEEKHYSSVKSVISTALALPLSCFFAYVFFKLEEMRREAEQSDAIEEE
jgi:hypothetical protein